MGLKSKITKSNTSKLIEQKTLDHYKYAIRTLKQAVITTRLQVIDPAHQEDI